MGKHVCGPKAMDRVEECICNKLPKPSLVTPYRIEKLSGLDHNIAEACLESMAPHPGQAGTLELCEETGEGRWLVRSASNPNEFWIDERDECVVEAIKTADKLVRLSSNEREDRAKALVSACTGRCSSDKSWLKDLIAGIGFGMLLALPVLLPTLMTSNQDTPQSKHMVCGRNKLYVRRDGWMNCSSYGSAYTVNDRGELVTNSPVSQPESGYTPSFPMSRVRAKRVSYL